MKKFLLLYFLFLVLFLSFFVSGVMDSQDGLQYLAVARNIYYTGKPTSPPYEYPEKNIHMSVYLGKDGNTYGATGLGYSLALVPAVAITDIFYKAYQISPQNHFPLENDWLILLTASFTNIFFAAGLTVILYLYFIELKLSQKQAFIMSLISLFATNLLVYAKNSFAHMMFVAFLTLSFYLIKKYFNSFKKRYLIFAGLSYGIMAITYNGSFVLTMPVLAIYFILLNKCRINLKSFTTLSLNLLHFAIGLFPLILIYIWFENVRSGGQASPDWYANYAKTYVFTTPISMFFEGIYGQLLSPGRSIFIYSPILLTIIFFWHKIRKVMVPELVVFILIALLYILFFATQFTWGDGGKLGAYGYAGLWHGEASWGPRYLLPLIPFGLLVVGSIYQRLTRIQKYLIFYPLVLIGFYIEVLGILVPYQIKNHNLERSFNINQTEFTSFTYGNLIPRYTPILSMTKSLIKFAKDFPKTIRHGVYNVRLYDGINLPFNVGTERWRVIENKGYISFDNLKKDSVKKMSFGLINHPIKTFSSSATLKFSLNGNPLEKETIFAPKQREIIEISINERLLKKRDNQLELIVDYEPPLANNSQIFAIISFNINNTAVNLESLDLPYYSPLGPAMVDAKYKTYGGEIKDPWRFWELHTQVYERTPDFWWVKAIYYWDYPKRAIAVVIAIITAAMLLFGLKTIISFRKLK